MKKLLATASVTMLMSTTAMAATYPTFQFDAASSSINLTQTGCIGWSCTLNASFNSDAVNLAPWTPSAPDAQLQIGNFIDWSVGGLGAGAYNVEVTLAFSTPDTASGNTTGGVLFATAFGAVSGGILSWNGPGTINFAQGSILDFYLDGTIAGGLGNSTTTGVTFKGNYIVPENDTTPSPVPLPASALLLLGGLAGLGAVRKLRKKAA